MFNRSILNSFGAAYLCLSLAPTAALADPVGDVLETPAMQTDMADEALLTDIEEVGDRLVAVGTRGHIIYSDDGGKTWAQASVPVSTLINAVDFADETHGWAVGHGATILHSSDAGETWQKQFDGYQASDLTIAQFEEQISELEEQIEQAPEDKRDELEIRLEELTFNLDDVQYDAEIGPWKPLLDVWFRNSREGFAIGAYGYIFGTRDGGESWQPLSDRVDNPDRSHLNAISPVTGGALFIAGEYGLLFRSIDNGTTWERIDAPYDGSFFGVTGTGNVNEVLVFGLRGHVFRSTDLGRSWAEVKIPERQTLSGAGVGKDNRVVLVGNNGLVAYSNNAGESFRAYTRPDRESLLNVVLRDDGKMVLVGETGVKIADPDGMNTKSATQ